MATKILKGISFPGLKDTYIIPEAAIELDSTLTETGKAADAAAVGDAINSLDTTIAVDENSDGNIEIRSYLPEQDYLQLDKSLTVEGAAAEGAATGVAISKSSSPYNYLDNSDFRNPVNQRGQTSYSNTSYTIDRWLSPVVGDISLTSDGMKLVGVETDYGTQNRQRVSHYETGKVYTFAVCDVDDEITIVSAIPSDSWTRTITTWGEIGLIVSGGYLTANIKVAASYTKTFRWAALYEGEYTAETLPDYKPKGYGAELAECHRYFRIVCNGENDTGVMTNPIGRIETHFQMRAKPAMLVVGSPYRVYTNATGQTYRDFATIVADNISTSVTQRIYVENCDATWMSVEVDFIAQGKHAGIFWSADL